MSVNLSNHAANDPLGGPLPEADFRMTMPPEPLPEPFLVQRTERVPPHSLEAEQAVLGALLVSPVALNTVVELLAPEQFYRPAHQSICAAALRLFNHNEPVDVLTVSEALQADNKLDAAGGRSYINELALGVLTIENTAYYANLIKDKALLRGLNQAGNTVVSLSYDETDAQSALDRAQAVIFKLAQQGAMESVVAIADILPDTFDQIEERHANKGSLMGTATGFYDLDQYTSGLQKSDLIILAARPSMGKTALCLNIVSHVGLREKRPVLFFSLEMSKEQLVQRMLCAEAEIDAQRIRTGEITEKDFQKLSQAMGTMGDAPIYIDDTSGLSVMEARAKARRLSMELHSTGLPPLGLIVIDYLQLMEGTSASGGSENRVQEISAISRGLKSIARELQVPVMALSQLSRAVESRQDKRPMLSDLRESGAIEQDADLVMFIYRDEYYNKETERPGTADIIIAKQRNGPVGDFELLFRHSITRFVNPHDRKTRVF